MNFKIFSELFHRSYINFRKWISILNLKKFCVSSILFLYLPEDIFASGVTVGKILLAKISSSEN